MTPTIRVSDLHKSYGEVAALSGINFDVAPGEIVGLLGPNGAGKSTTLETLCALRIPDSGSIFVNGIDPVSDPRGVQAQLGTVLQSVALDPMMTPVEAVSLQIRLRGGSSLSARKQAATALHRAGLSGIEDGRIGDLSGGQRRRVDLTVATVDDPPVLLLDEPTSGLDSDSRHTLWGRLRHLASMGTSIVLSTQDLNEAERLSDRVVILREGRVVASAVPTDLKRDVGTRSLTLTLPSSADRDRAIRLAKSLGVPAMGGDSPDSVHVRLNAEFTSPGQYLASLATSGVEIVNLNLDEPSLDDVFLRLTNADEKAEVHRA